MKRISNRGGRLWIYQIPANHLMVLKIVQRHYPRKCASLRTVNLLFILPVLALALVKGSYLNNKCCELVANSQFREILVVSN